MSVRPAVPPEFSRPVRVDALAQTGRSFHAVANGRERAALAARFSIQSISRLEVSGVATPARGGTAVRVLAHLVATVTQECVVTLAPVDSELDVEFERLYSADIASGEADVGEDIYLGGDEDDIDPLVDDCVDVGEAAAEQLALELDPYPRTRDARLDTGWGEGDPTRPQGSAPPASAFSALGRLKSPPVSTKRRK